MGVDVGVAGPLPAGNTVLRRRLHGGGGRTRSNPGMCSFGAHR